MKYMFLGMALVSWVLLVASLFITMDVSFSRVGVTFWVCLGFYNVLDKLDKDK